GRLTFSTIAEVLDGEIDLHSIWMKLSDYHNIIHDLYMKASNWLETLDEDDPKFSDLDIEIGDLNRFTYDKIDAAQELIDLLQDILNKEEEEGI
ncbi:MAG: hypothetical protein GTO02_18290, partial [Candidatus Dadabacteria bacterium]|nr:hypothetical protein [Candidatus Dadabacteria bacterium]